MDQRDIFETWPGWETVRVIGRGSYGVVYELRRDAPGSTERAALKCIAIPRDESEVRDLQSDGMSREEISRSFNEMARRLVREYTLMKRLKDCPNVVKCQDFSSVQKSSGLGWNISILMELLTPLTEWLATDPETTEKLALDMGMDLCRALVACRKENILHRDIKPQNIFINGEGRFKLGDFGIARIAGSSSTATNRIGTYSYMAPEVYNDQPYDHRADICSVGLVLYWLLNQKRGPFLPPPPYMPSNEEREEARQRRFRGEALPPPAGGSEAMKRIVLKACAFSAEDRYQTPNAMLRDLEKLAESGAWKAEAGGGQRPPASPGETAEPSAKTGLRRAVPAGAAAAPQAGAESGTRSPRPDPQHHSRNPEYRAEQSAGPSLRPRPAERGGEPGTRNPRANQASAARNGEHRADQNTALPHRPRPAEGKESTSPGKAAFGPEKRANKPEVQSAPAPKTQRKASAPARTAAASPTPWMASKSSYRAASPTSQKTREEEPSPDRKKGKGKLLIPLFAILAAAAVLMLVLLPKGGDSLKKDPAAGSSEKAPWTEGRPSYIADEKTGMSPSAVLESLLLPEPSPEASEAPTPTPSPTPVPSPTPEPSYWPQPSPSAMPTTPEPSEPGPTDSWWNNSGGGDNGGGDNDGGDNGGCETGGGDNDGGDNGGDNGGENGGGDNGGGDNGGVDTGVDCGGSGDTGGDCGGSGDTGGDCGGSGGDNGGSGGDNGGDGWWP